MKIRILLIALIVSVCLILSPYVLAEDLDPIKASIQYSPATISGPQDVEVNITITNVGSEDMTEPVTLYNPEGKIIKEFGEEGQVLLTVGSSKTYTGKWSLKQSDLENGEIKYYIKYKMLDKNGEAKSITKQLPVKYDYAKVEDSLSITRDINPKFAKKNQDVNVTYTFINNTDKAIKNIKVSEDKSLAKKPQTLNQLDPGDTKKIVFTKKMASKDIKSAGRVSYKENNKLKKKNFDSETITLGQSNISVKLKASETGVVVGEEITLDLVIENKGNVDYYNLSVSDEKLGEIFSGETSTAGSVLKLSKTITMQENQDFEFKVVASDSTGEKIETKSNKVTVKTILESQKLSLSVQTVSDKDVFYDDGGRIKFTISVKNNSLGEAKNVEIWQRDVKIYTFSNIAPGQTKTVSRDFTLSQSGKYMFEARAKDSIGEENVFKGNEIYIEVIAPTAPPVVITPSPIPPLETIAPKAWNDAPKSFEHTGKAFNTLSIIFAVVSIILVLLILVSFALRLITIRKAKLAKASITDVSTYRDYFKESEDTDNEDSEHASTNDASIDFDNFNIDDTTAPFADSVSDNSEETEQTNEKRNRRRSPKDDI